MPNLIDEKREYNALMINDFFNIINVDLKKMTELERQLIAAFSFGMIYAEGFINKIKPETIEVLSIYMLQDSFDYQPEQSVSYTEILIKASIKRSFHSTINAVIHRGIDGHQQWKEDKKDLLKSNVIEILKLHN